MKFINNMWENRFKLVQNKLCHLDFKKLEKVFPCVNDKIKTLSQLQNHEYRNPNIAAVALFHSSALVYWPKDKSGIVSNECLEYLGDAFLSFYMATESILLDRQMKEGELTRVRSALVSTKMFSHKAKVVGLGECLLMGKTNCNLADDKMENIFADAFEAVTAALLLDAGFEVVDRWLREVFEEEFSRGPTTLLEFDAKSRLQQWTQGVIGVPPVYKVIGTEGTPQETFFILSCQIGDVEVARTVGSSKKEASKRLAEITLDKIARGEITREFISTHHGKK